jgi:hypothetical protein
MKYLRRCQSRFFLLWHEVTFSGHAGCSWRLFGLIFGGSDHAREKLTEQLQNLIDPSGIKVIQDIAANASRPQAGFIATTIGVVLTLFGASGVFGQLQDALNPCDDYDYGQREQFEGGSVHFAGIAEFVERPGSRSSDLGQCRL